MRDNGCWLIACEESGTVRDAFIRVGLNAISCDLKPTRARGPHYRGDVRDLLHYRWRGIIAHPVCTYLNNAGVRWLYTPSRNPETVTHERRWQAMREAAEFFRLFLDHPCAHVAIENPVMNPHALALIGGVKHTQTVQPYEYGHLETKRTCLWLRGLPPLQPTNNVEAAMRLLPKRETHKVHYASPGADRAERRSVFFPGIADAMAVQWGLWLEQQLAKAA